MDLDVDVPDQSGKTFIVTGANSGVGFALSSLLAARRARVLLACRDKAKADAAISRIRQNTPDADLAFLPLDLSDLKSVRTAAELAAREPHIDVLINNAAVADSKRKVTAQGFELTFGVNHLGSFAFTSLLLPKLMKMSQSRIVVTSSGIYQTANIDWDDLNAEKNYKGMQRYAVSKLN